MRSVMFAFALTLAFIITVERCCGGRCGILIDLGNGFMEMEVVIVIKVEIVGWCQQWYCLILRPETWGFDRREFPTLARKPCRSLGGRYLRELLFFRCPSEMRREPERNMSFLRWHNNFIHCVEFLQRRAVREAHRFA